MRKSQTNIFGFTILFSFLIYLSFKPWEYTDFAQHIMMISLVLFFSLAISSFLVAKKFKAFWIAIIFFSTGLFFLYRGLYLKNQFYLLDYFFSNKDFVRVVGNTTIYGEPISYFWIESMLIYCILSITGLTIGYFAEKK